MVRVSPGSSITQLSSMGAFFAPDSTENIFPQNFHAPAGLGSVAVTITGCTGTNPMGAQDPQSPNPFSQLGMNLFPHSMRIPVWGWGCGL